MRYFITDYRNEQAKEDIRSLGLYCYSLRSTDGSWNDIATIENHVLINRYGSIITDEEIKLGDKYPDDFIDFNEFAMKNKKVGSITELRSDLEDYGIIDLSDNDEIENEFTNLFESSEDFLELDEMSYQDKYDYIINHYKNVNDYEIILKGGHIYELYHIAPKKEKEMELSND